MCPHNVLKASLLFSLSTSIAITINFFQPFFYIGSELKHSAVFS